MSEIICPKCRKVYESIDELNCIGACNDNVFCTNCHCEFDTSTGAVHQCGKDALDAARDRESGIICTG